MHIDSVRELKASVTQSLLMPMLKPARMRAAGAVRGLSAFSASSMEDVSGTHRYLALGVAKSGKRQYALAVRIQRRELQSSGILDAIVKKSKGEVDVRYIGRAVKRATAARPTWNQKRVRPLVPGISVGHYEITAGTLGCFVKDRQDQTAFMLSNNHVLANENDAEAGDAILQPGQYDGGKKPADVVGKLVRFIALKPTRPNLVDCAVASIGDKIKFNAKKLRGLGAIAGLGASLDIGDKIESRTAIIADYGRSFPGTCTRC